MSEGHARVRACVGLRVAACASAVRAYEYCSRPSAAVYHTTRYIRVCVL